MAIIKALQLKKDIVIFTAHIHPECDPTPVTAFKKSLKQGGWILSKHDVYYPDFGDSVADSAMLIMGIQRTCSQYNMPIVCPTPPDVPGSTPGEFAYLLFNKREVSVFPARMDGNFHDSYLVASYPCSETAAKGHTVSKRI